MASREEKRARARIHLNPVTGIFNNAGIGAKDAQRLSNFYNRSKTWINGNKYVNMKKTDTETEVPFDMDGKKIRTVENTKTKNLFLRRPARLGIRIASLALPIGVAWKLTKSSYGVLAGKTVGVMTAGIATGVGLVAIDKWIAPHIVSLVKMRARRNKINNILTSEGLTDSEKASLRHDNIDVKSDDYYIKSEHDKVEAKLNLINGVYAENKTIEENFNDMLNILTGKAEQFKAGTITERDLSEYYINECYSRLNYASGGVDLSLEMQESLGDESFIHVKNLANDDVDVKNRAVNSLRDLYLEGRTLGMGGTTVDSVLDPTILSDGRRAYFQQPERINLHELMTEPNYLENHLILDGDGDRITDSKSLKAQAKVLTTEYQTALPRANKTPIFSSLTAGILTAGKGVAHGAWWVGSNILNKLTRGRRGLIAKRNQFIEACNNGNIDRQASILSDLSDKQTAFIMKALNWRDDGKVGIYEPLYRSAQTSSLYNKISKYVGGKDTAIKSNLGLFKANVNENFNIGTILNDVNDEVLSDLQNQDDHHLTANQRAGRTGYASFNKLTRAETFKEPVEITIYKEIPKTRRRFLGLFGRRVEREGKSKVVPIATLSFSSKAALEKALPRLAQAAKDDGHITAFNISSGIGRPISLNPQSSNFIANAQRVGEEFTIGNSLGKRYLYVNKNVEDVGGDTYDDLFTGFGGDGYGPGPFGGGGGYIPPFGDGGGYGPGPFGGGGGGYRPGPFVGDDFDIPPVDEDEDVTRSGLISELQDKIAEFKSEPEYVNPAFVVLNIRDITDGKDIERFVLNKETFTNSEDILDSFKHISGLEISLTEVDLSSSVRLKTDDPNFQAELENNIERLYFKLNPELEPDKDDSRFIRDIDDEVDTEESELEVPFDTYDDDKPEKPKTFEEMVSGFTSYNTPKPEKPKTSEEMVSGFAEYPKASDEEVLRANLEQIMLDDLKKENPKMLVEELGKKGAEIFENIQRMSIEEVERLVNERDALDRANIAKIEMERGRIPYINISHYKNELDEEYVEVGVTYEACDGLDDYRNPLIVDSVKFNIYPVPARFVDDVQSIFRESFGEDRRVAVENVKAQLNRLKDDIKEKTIKVDDIETTIAAPEFVIEKIESLFITKETEINTDENEADNDNVDENEIGVGEDGHYDIDIDEVSAHLTQEEYELYGKILDDEDVFYEDISENLYISVEIKYDNDKKTEIFFYSPTAFADKMPEIIEKVSDIYEDAEIDMGIYNANNENLQITENKQLEDIPLYEASRLHVFSTRDIREAGAEECDKIVEKFARLQKEDAELDLDDNNEFKANEDETNDNDENLEDKQYSIEFEWNQDIRRDEITDAEYIINNVIATKYNADGREEDATELSFTNIPGDNNDFLNELQGKVEKYITDNQGDIFNVEAEEFIAKVYLTDILDEENSLRDVTAGSIEFSINKDYEVSGDKIIISADNTICAGIAEIVSDMVKELKTDISDLNVEDENIDGDSVDKDETATELFTDLNDDIIITKNNAIVEDETAGETKDNEIVGTDDTSVNYNEGYQSDLDNALEAKERLENENADLKNKLQEQASEAEALRNNVIELFTATKAEVFKLRAQEITENLKNGPIIPAVNISEIIIKMAQQIINLNAEDVTGTGVEKPQSDTDIESDAEQLALSAEVRSNITSLLNVMGSNFDMISENITTSTNKLELTKELRYVEQQLTKIYLGIAKADKDKIKIEPLVKRVSELSDAVKKGISKDYDLSGKVKELKEAIDAVSSAKEFNISRDEQKVILKKEESKFLEIKITLESKLTKLSTGLRKEKEQSQIEGLRTLNERVQLYAKVCEKIRQEYDANHTVRAELRKSFLLLGQEIRTKLFYEADDYTRADGTTSARRVHKAGDQRKLYVGRASEMKSMLEEGIFTIFNETTSSYENQINLMKQEIEFKREKISADEELETSEVSGAGVIVRVQDMSNPDKVKNIQEYLRTVKKACKELQEVMHKYRVYTGVGIDKTLAAEEDIKGIMKLFYEKGSRLTSEDIAEMERLANRRRFEDDGKHAKDGKGIETIGVEDYSRGIGLKTNPYGKAITIYEGRANKLGELEPLELPTKLVQKLTDNVVKLEKDAMKKIGVDDDDMDVSDIDDSILDTEDGKYVNSPVLKKITDIKDRVKNILDEKIAADIVLSDEEILENNSIDSDDINL